MKKISYPILIKYMVMYIYILIKMQYFKVLLKGKQNNSRIIIIIETCFYNRTFNDNFSNTIQNYKS